MKKRKATLPMKADAVTIKNLLLQHFRLKMSQEDLEFLEQSVDLYGETYAKEHLADVRALDF